MSPHRLVIVPVMVDGEQRWRLIHVGWFRIRVLAESPKCERIVDAAQRLVGVLS